MLKDGSCRSRRNDLQRSSVWWVPLFALFLHVPRMPVQRPAHLPTPLRPQAGPATQLAFLLLLTVLAYAAALLAEGADLAERTRWLRLWTLAGAGVFAVATPNLLFPDAGAPVLQMLNRSPGGLVRHQMRRLLPLLALLVLPVLVLAFLNPSGFLQALPQKADMAGQTLVLLTATALDSFVYYTTLGRRSQAWHEGQAGGWYARLADSGHGVSLPRGLVPALFATARCFALAVSFVLLAAHQTQQGNPTLAWFMCLLFLFGPGLRLAQQRGAFDRHFYQTNAFYAEVLGGGSLRATDREPVAMDSLYWVPSRWRPAVWAGLRQMDRRLPLGRLIALAHLGLWVLCLQEAAPSAVGGYLLLLFVAQTASVAVLASPSAAPRAFQLTMQSPADWFVTRAFINLRWFAPHAASLGLVVLFDASYGLPWTATWLAVHLACTLAAAALLTLTTETRARQSLQ